MAMLLVDHSKPLKVVRIVNKYEKEFEWKWKRKGFPLSDPFCVAGKCVTYTFSGTTTTKVAAATMWSFVFEVRQSERGGGIVKLGGGVVKFHFIFQPFHLST